MGQQYAIPVKVGAVIPVLKYVIAVVKANVMILVTKAAWGVVAILVMAVAKMLSNISI